MDNTRYFIKKDAS